MFYFNDYYFFRQHLIQKALFEKQYLVIVNLFIKDYN